MYLFVYTPTSQWEVRADYSSKVDSSNLYRTVEVKVDTGRYVKQIILNLQYRGKFPNTMIDV